MTEAVGLGASDSLHSTPTILLFQNGQVVDRVVGAPPEELLREKLSSLAPAA